MTCQCPADCPAMPQQPPTSQLPERSADRNPDTGLAFGNGGVSYAERTLPSGLAALLVASVPLWMALADRVINGQRIRPAGWLALVIGLAGVAILDQPHGSPGRCPPT